MKSGSVTAFFAYYYEEKKLWQQEEMQGEVVEGHAGELGEETAPAKAWVTEILLGNPRRNNQQHTCIVYNLLITLINNKNSLNILSKFILLVL